MKSLQEQITELEAELQERRTAIDTFRKYANGNVDAFATQTVTLEGKLQGLRAALATMAEATGPQQSEGQQSGAGLQTCGGTSPYQDNSSNG